MEGASSCFYASSVVVVFVLVGFVVFIVVGFDVEGNGLFQL